jgi:pimeloyl-ACP methyl ester carboxylesterase
MTSTSVTIPSAGRLLAGELFGRVEQVQDVGAMRPGVLFVHGLGSSQNGYHVRAREVVARVGAVCLTFDLTGHGAGRSRSEYARSTPRDHLTDVVAAYRLLAGVPGLDAGRIGVCGASYGAYLAVLLTGEMPVARLALRAPGMYDDASFDTPLEHGRVSSVVPPTAAVRTRLAQFLGPVLLVQSGADEAIPAEVCEAYLHDRPGAKHVVIAGAGHRLTEPSWAAQFMTATTDFFADL